MAKKATTRKATVRKSTVVSRRKKKYSQIAGFSAIIMTLLGGLSVIPYELGNSSIIIPAEFKQPLTLIGLISGAFLKVAEKYLSR